MRLTGKQLADLQQELGKDKLNWMLDKLNATKDGSGKGYSPGYDYASLRADGWVRDSWENHMAKMGNSKPGSRKVVGNYAKECAQKAKDSWNSPFYRLDICPSHVELVPLGGTGCPDILGYEEHGFAEQLESLLRKRGFLPRPVG